MSEKLLSAVDAMLQSRAVLEASPSTEGVRAFDAKVAAHVAAIKALELAAKEERAQQLSLAHYAAPVETPKTRRRGLMNAVQMAINKAAQLDPRETVLLLVDLLDDLGSKSNPYRVAGDV